MNKSLRNERERVLSMADYGNKQADKSTKFYGSPFPALFQRRIEEGFRVLKGVHLYCLVSTRGVFNVAFTPAFRAPRKGAGSAPPVPLYQPRHARSEKADHLLKRLRDLRAQHGDGDCNGEPCMPPSHQVSRSIL